MASIRHKLDKQEYFLIFFDVDFFKGILEFIKFYQSGNVDNLSPDTLVAEI